MPRSFRIYFCIQLITSWTMIPAFADSVVCQARLEKSVYATSTDWLKKQIIDKALDVMAVMKGLPKYHGQIEESKRLKSYLDDYHDFGEMGLAEIGISVRYNQADVGRINTGRPLIIIANHHLGIVDGLILQYLSSRTRQNAPSLLLLARWIEKLLPHAIFGDENHWGTAIPVEINQPKPNDPEYQAKLAEMKAFNSSWGRKSARALRDGGALIIFPAGHVAAINPGASYPEGVRDDPDSWQDGFLALAKLGKADIVFANVNAVNSRAFYRDRKRFGGGDKERVVWFFGEAVAMKGKAVDVYVSKPMALDDIYTTLAQKYQSTREALLADPHLTAELMRRYSYTLSDAGPRTLDTVESPTKQTAARRRAEDQVRKAN